MIDEYQRALKSFYKEKKDSHNLSSGLENPNRTRLKQEFLRLYRLNNEESDTAILKNFFDPENKYDDQLDSIARIEIDKMRPLVTFLTGDSKLQTDEPVHALAWLLGFTPYPKWKLDYLAEGNTGIEVRTVENDSDKANGGTKGGKGKLRTARGYSQIYLFISITILIVVAGMGAIWGYRSLDKVNQPNPAEKCMSWDDSHYVPVKCDEYAVKELAIPLDIRVLNHMRKIRWPDLLTKKDLGKVWYAKNDGKPEFFTDSGRYPVDPQKKLKPLTAYMLNHYVNYYRFILEVFMCFMALIIAMMFLYVVVKNILPRHKFGY